MIQEIIKKSIFCRKFEDHVYKKIEDKTIKIPVYLSAGQEVIPATISEFCLQNKIKPNIFAQHRCHSVYLSFGGEPKKLVHELLGLDSGCSSGMGGSASIHDPSINMYGHDGMMGSQVPIAVGFCYTTKKPTIVFVGDAAAEEDYVLASIGWAATKNLPILFVVEDNNLSILTEKKVRRSWEMSSVASSMGIKSIDLQDSPDNILNISRFWFKEPVLLNLRTERLYYHAGAGKDPGEKLDRLQEIKKQANFNTSQFELEIEKEIEKLWKL